MSCNQSHAHGVRVDGRVRELVQVLNAEFE